MEEREERDFRHSLANLACLLVHCYCWATLSVKVAVIIAPLCYYGRYQTDLSGTGHRLRNNAAIPALLLEIMAWQWQWIWIWKLVLNLCAEIDELFLSSEFQRHVISVDNKFVTIATYCNRLLNRMRY